MTVAIVDRLRVIAQVNTRIAYNSVAIDPLTVTT
jgi:hypothetical protein